VGLTWMPWSPTTFANDHGACVFAVQRRRPVLSASHEILVLKRKIHRWGWYAPYQGSSSTKSTAKRSAPRPSASQSNGHGRKVQLNAMFFLSDTIESTMLAARFDWHLHFVPFEAGQPCICPRSLLFPCTHCHGNPPLNHGRADVGVALSFLALACPPFHRHKHPPSSS